MNSPLNDNITSVLFSLVNKSNITSNGNINILNISCDVSRVYKEIVSKYNNINVYNIEMDSSYKNNLELYPNTILGNINTIDLDLFDLNDKENQFDIIIVDDTIQKFIDPWSILKSLHLYLKSNGYLFASIPNMMHINNLINIINGRFEFTASGPLDKDNLRFFTLGGIRELFLSTGYNIEEISSVSTERKNPELSVVNALTPSNDSEFTNQYFCFEYIFKTTPCQVKTLFDYVL